MKYFVCEYNRDTGKMVSLAQYDNPADAAGRLAELTPSGSIEPLLFDAENLEALRAEYPQYFSWAGKPTRGETTI